MSLAKSIEHSLIVGGVIVPMSVTEFTLNEGKATEAVRGKDGSPVEFVSTTNDPVITLVINPSHYTDLCNALGVNTLNSLPVDTQIAWVDTNFFPPRARVMLGCSVQPHDVGATQSPADLTITVNGTRIDRKLN